MGFDGLEGFTGSWVEKSGEGLAPAFGKADAPVARRDAYLQEFGFRVFFRRFLYGSPR